jgi:hypothetical protein
MERILFGDNQFFAVNHLSDEKSRQQSIRFKDNEAIIKVLDQVQEMGIHTFMCTTHERIGEICDYIRLNPDGYKGFKIYPSMPYAHKYANAVTEYGIVGALKQYLPGNIFSTFARGGAAVVSKDFIKMMQLLVDAEMKMFKGIETPVIFLQNVLVDLILGLDMNEVFREFDAYVKRKYNAEAGFITMNLPALLDALESVGLKNPIICSSINKIGFRMSGGIEAYEETLLQREFRPIAMQVLAAGALRPQEAIEYLSRFNKIESILFGASTKAHIYETKQIIDQYFDSPSQQRTL